MEDKTTSEVLHDKAFFGVYDGHGGRQAAELCQENLHKHLMREISKHWYTPLPRQPLSNVWQARDTRVANNRF